MYNSKYYTCEQIDQRLLEGYYDDAVAAGYTGSKAQYLAGLLKAINYAANPTITADKVVYNPAISGLTSKNIQGAVDELRDLSVIETLEGSYESLGYYALPNTNIGQRYKVLVTTTTSGTFGLTLNSEETSGSEVQEISKNTMYDAGTHSFDFTIKVANANKLRIANLATGKFDNISNVKI